MRFLLNVWKELVSLLVDDGFLAIAALVAIGLTWFLSRAEVVGATNALGWLLFGLLAASTVISARRGVIASRER